MNTGNISEYVVRCAKMPAQTAAASDVVTTICDMGGCQDATAIINYNYTTDAVIEVKFWTSTSDSCGVTGTAQAATTNTVAVEVTSDKDNLVAKDTSGNNISDLTVANNGISSIGFDGTVVVELPNIRRYLYCQYTGLGTGSYVGIVFVGKNGQEAPWSGPAAAY
jgi:hypothetical protein